VIFFNSDSPLHSRNRFAEALAISSVNTDLKAFVNGNPFCAFFIAFDIPSPT
jgi:hypothetical protein